MNLTAYERALAAEAAPKNRAERRARDRSLARNQRTQRRSRARIERALSAFPKEGTP